MDAAPVCAACHTPLQRGVTLDRGYNDRYHVSEWVEGVPEPGFWQGLKLGDRLRLPVETWRCPACGLLASFARTVSPG